MSLLPLVATRSKLSRLIDRPKWWSEAKLSKRKIALSVCEAFPKNGERAK